MQASDVHADERTNGPLSKKGARTRERLLEAAKKVFEANGFLDARISDIAEAAGLSHGSFYYYFDSKEQIFRGVAEAVDAELGAPLDDVILGSESSVPPQDRLREAIRRYFESYRDEAGIMGVIEQVSRYDDHVHALRVEQHRRYRAKVAESIQQLQRHRLADPELDPGLVAAAMGALTDRFAEMWLVQGIVDCTLEEAVDQVSRMFVNMLGLGGNRRGVRTPR